MKSTSALNIPMFFAPCRYIDAIDIPKATHVFLFLKTAGFAPKNWTTEVRFCILNLQKMASPSAAVGYETHISTEVTKRQMLLAEIRHKWDPAPSDVKFYSIRNLRKKKRIDYKGSALYLSEDGITHDSETFLNTAVHQCVTSDDCFNATLQWN